jgi:AcrR family transcriptional regulator
MVSAPQQLVIPGEARSGTRHVHRRQRLMRAALELFADLGYEEASVGAIVGRARMSKSAFYEYFTSKEHCFREVLADEGGALIHEVLSEAATGHDHHERLRLGITRFVRACFARSAAARVLIVESVGLSAAVDRVRQEVQGRLAAAVAEEVRHARGHDPFYADKNPDVFGRAVVGAVNDAVSYYLMHPGGDADSLAAELCKIFAP